MEKAMKASHFVARIFCAGPAFVMDENRRIESKKATLK